MQNSNILVVEDDAALSSALCDTLDLAGYQATSATNGVEALKQISAQSFGMVISDVNMGKMDGLTLLSKIKAQRPDLPVLLMTAYGTIERAVEAMQAGAIDYLVKPFEADTLIRQVQQNLLATQSSAKDYIVTDANMQKLFALASRVSKADVTVLIQGESGTGKEIIARHVHKCSNRKAEPFVAINCAAIPENMLEATLFGFEKGAFTGAHQATPGKFELAQKGTLLLDEISEMDLALQAKILRVLQEKEVERLGGHKVIELDVRVLATTNLNLKEQVSKGRFREDLFYRLNVFPLRIPPLRERSLDIVPLANRFLEKYSPTAKSIPEFEPEAINLLLKYRWPGNVRELENVVQRALIICTGDTIAIDDIVLEDGTKNCADSNEEQQGEAIDKLDDNLKSMEDQIILRTLIEEKGSRKSTAERLGISPRTLRYKIARIRDDGVALPC